MGPSARLDGSACTDEDRTRAVAGQSDDPKETRWQCDMGKGQLGLSTMNRQGA